MVQPLVLSVIVVMIFMIKHLFRLLKFIVFIIFISNSTSQYLWSNCLLARCENSLLWTEPHWKIDPSDFEFAMTMVAKSENGRINVPDTTFEIGAFAGEELRGTTESFYIPELGVNLFFLTIFGNENGDSLTFRLFDRTKNIEVELNEGLEFAVNAHIGSVESPFVFTGITTLTYLSSLIHNFSIYPNPAKSYLNLEFSDPSPKEINISIIGIGGMLFQSCNKFLIPSQNVERLNIDFLIPGRYLLIIRESNTGNYRIGKFIKSP